MCFFIFYDIVIIVLENLLNKCTTNEIKLLENMGIIIDDKVDVSLVEELIEQSYELTNNEVL